MESVALFSDEICGWFRLPLQGGAGSNAEGTTGRSRDLPAEFQFRLWLFLPLFATVPLYGVWARPAMMMRRGSLKCRPTPSVTRRRKGEPLAVIGGCFAGPPQTDVTPLIGSSAWTRYKSQHRLTSVSFTTFSSVASSALHPSLRQIKRYRPIIISIASLPRL